MEDGDVTPAQAAEGPPPFMSAKPAKWPRFCSIEPIKALALGYA